MIKPFRFNNIRILTFLLILHIFTTIGHAQTSVTSKKHDIPMEYRYESVYLDTITIRTPVLVNINGVGYLNSRTNLNMSHPEDIANHIETCILLNRFYFDKRVFHTPFRWLMDDFTSTLNRAMETYLQNTSMIFPFEPTSKGLPFKYLCTENDIDIYDSELKNLPIFVFLVRISYVNVLLNPKLEISDLSKIEFDINQVRKIPSVYPDMEYVRVAVLGTFASEDNEE